MAYRDNWKPADEGYQGPFPPDHPVWERLTRRGKFATWMVWYLACCAAGMTLGASCTYGHWAWQAPPSARPPEGWQEVVIDVVRDVTGVDAPTPRIMVAADVAEANRWCGTDYGTAVGCWPAKWTGRHAWVVVQADHPTGVQGQLVHELIHWAVADVTGLDPDREHLRPGAWACHTRRSPGCAESWEQRALDAFYRRTAP